MAGFSPDEGGSCVEDFCWPTGEADLRISTRWQGWVMEAVCGQWRVKGGGCIIIADKSASAAFLLQSNEDLREAWKEEIINYSVNLFILGNLGDGTKEIWISVNYNGPVSREHQGFESFWTLCASKCIFYYWATERERESMNSQMTWIFQWVLTMKSGNFILKTEALPAGAQEDIIDNRKKQEVPHSVGPSSVGPAGAKHL